MIAGLLLGALLAAGEAAAPAEAPAAPAPPRLRLERLQAPGLDAGLVEAVEHGLCEALAEASGADVACPADLAAAAQVVRQSVLLGAATSDEGLRQLDAARASGRLVRGSLAPAGAGYRLRLSLSGPGAAAAAAEAELPGGLDALLARLPALARQLLK